MAGPPLNEVINLISSEEEGGRSDDDEEPWSEGDMPEASDSDEDLLPAVGPAVGDEDEEDSLDEDVQMRSPSPPVYESPVHEPHIPALDPRQLYTMDHSAASLPIPVSVPVPDFFTRLGLRNSGHFDQYLRSASRGTLEAPPHAEHMTDMQAGTAAALRIMARREAENLLTVREVLAATQETLSELHRAEFALARMATDPVMVAVARAQGAELRVPEDIQRRATAPPTAFIYGAGHATVPVAGGSNAPPAQVARPSASTSGGLPRRATPGPSRSRLDPPAAPSESPSQRPRPSNSPAPQVGETARRSAGRRAFVEANAPVSFPPAAHGVLEEPLGDAATRRATLARMKAPRQNAVASGSGVSRNLTRFDRRHEIETAQQRQRPGAEQAAAAGSVQHRRRRDRRDSDGDREASKRAKTRR